MHLVGVELIRVTLHLDRPIVTSAGAHHERPVIYVHVVCDHGEGWGESAALLEGTAVDPSHSQVWKLLKQTLVPELVARGRDWRVEPGYEFAEMTQQDSSDGRAAARRAGGAALQMALTDLELCRQSQSLAASWNVPADRAVEVGAVVGIPEGRDLNDLVDQVQRVIAEGYLRARIKIGPGWDVAPLRALREAFPTFGLQADCNAAYRSGGGDLDDVQRLIPLDELSLLCIEQPLAAQDLHGHAVLVRRLSTPIGLDESACSPERLEEIMSLGAAGVVCLKPDRMGGLEGARRATGRCQAAGIDTFVGGFFETGLGRAGNLAVAALAESPFPSDVGDPESYLRDPCGYPQVRDGLVSPSDTPGVGSPPLRERLTALGAQIEWVGVP